MRCEHGTEWEVTSVDDGEPRRWRCAYPPPPPGSVFLCADGDIPEPDHVLASWRLESVEWFAGLCSCCGETIVTPLVRLQRVAP